MNNHGSVSAVVKILFTLTALLSSQQVLSSSYSTSEYTFAEGGFYLTDTSGRNYQGGGAGSYEGGDSINPYGFTGSEVNSGVTGYAGSSLEFFPYSEDRYMGNVSSGSEVLDPLNQVSFVQADGETTIDFTINLLKAHTYTLTGNTSVIGAGRIDILFDTVRFTQLDDTFSLTGTLEAGSYKFSAYTIAALSATGTVFTSYDFDLQLQEVSAVPVPAAFWLFSSGLIGLIGLARAKK